MNLVMITTLLFSVSRALCSLKLFLGYHSNTKNITYQVLLLFSEFLFLFFLLGYRSKHHHHLLNHTSLHCSFISYSQIQSINKFRCFVLFPSAEVDCGWQYLSKGSLNHSAWIVSTWTVSTASFSLPSAF